MNLYRVYYNQQDKAVCVERQSANGIIKVIGFDPIDPDTFSRLGL